MIRGGAKRKVKSKTDKKILKPLSRRKDYPTRRRVSRASANMSITDLQFLAKSRGIPFGGLTKSKLIRKINNY